MPRRLRVLLLVSATASAFAATPGWSQSTAQPGPAAPESAKPANDQGNVPSNTGDGSGNGQQQRDEPAAAAGDIIVTATRRNEALSDVPLAVSAVTAATLQNTGAADIRQLNQVSPSLLVSSTSSEAAAGGARIRGIGTVGDNPGLESSVATFIDGVYRNRAGVGLTELGAIDRIEVLRGPQGTLFGRNASAGLISVITAKPSFTFGGEGEATIGNYAQYRLQGGITGPITQQLAARLDGVYFKRDGFFQDVISGRRVNGRDRYLVRGQLLFQPTDDFSLRLIGDYSDRREECCAAAYFPVSDVTLAGDGSGAVRFQPSSIAAIERGLGAVIPDNTFARQASITPGVDYRGNVKDRGVSGEINYKFGNATLTSITAYREWNLLRGQDADFNNLDLLRRLSDGGATQRFDTFTQEVRLQGTAFDQKLDYLVGGFYAHEILGLTDNLQYGNDYEAYSNCLTAFSLANAAGQPGLVSTASPGCLNPAITRAIVTNPAVPAALRGPLGLLGGFAIPGVFGYRAVAAAAGVPGAPLAGVGGFDRFRQVSRNYAFFTHNVIHLTDTVNLTLGARYTNERKTLDATFTDNNNVCRAVAASPAVAGLQTLPCVIPATPTGTLVQNGREKSEDRVTGTAVLSFRPSRGNLLYASYSRGYKAGGFNLDRAALARNPAAPGTISPTADTLGLTFDPEIVNAFEVGFKLNRPGFDLNIAGFYQRFSGFQLNTFNGVNFIVVNINACNQSLNGADRDPSPMTGACPNNQLKSGVSTKGLELEAFIRPARHVNVNLGLTYARTRYSSDLVGTNGAPLPPVLSNLPGSQLSNAPLYVATGSVAFTPPLGDSGLSGLLYTDFRYQSDTNTGSDLDREKIQDGFIVVNARVGIRGPQARWGLELWAQNVFNQQYQQVAFDAPLQGGGVPASPVSAGVNTVQQGYIQRSTQLFGAFLGEPRTYGVTARFKF